MIEFCRYSTPKRKGQLRRLFVSVVPTTTCPITASTRAWQVSCQARELTSSSSNSNQNSSEQSKSAHQLLIDVLVPLFKHLLALFQVVCSAVSPHNRIVLDMREAGLRYCEVNAMLGHPGTAH